MTERWFIPYTESTRRSCSYRYDLPLIIPDSDVEKERDVFKQKTVGDLKLLSFVLMKFHIEIIIFIRNVTCIYFFCIYVKTFIIIMIIQYCD